MKSLETLREQIESCRKLKTNWNGYGAAALSSATIEFALAVADRLEGLGLTLAVPTNDGGIEISDEDTSRWVKILVDELRTGLGPCAGTTRPKQS